MGLNHKVYWIGKINDEELEIQLKW
jgi:hypothetical protein